MDAIPTLPPPRLASPPALSSLSHTSDATEPPVEIASQGTLPTSTTEAATIARSFCARSVVTPCVDCRRTAPHHGTLVFFAATLPTRAPPPHSSKARPRGGAVSARRAHRGSALYPVVARGRMLRSQP